MVDLEVAGGPGGEDWRGWRMAGEGVEGGVRELAGGDGGCGVAEEAAAVHGHFYHRWRGFDWS